MKGRLLLAALSLASSSAGAQPATRPQTAAAASDAEDPRRLAALGLTPFERHREIIRYTFTAPELSGGRAIGFRQVVVQLVPGPDGRSAALTLVTGRAPAAGAMRALSRRNETLSLEEYRILRSQLVRYASDLDISEQDVTTAVEACENGPAARFDMKLGGDSRMVLTRTGGCNGDATAYKAGDFLLVAAERILGAPIEGARPPR